MSRLENGGGWENAEYYLQSESKPRVSGIMERLTPQQRQVLMPALVDRQGLYQRQVLSGILEEVRNGSAQMTVYEDPRTGQVSLQVESLSQDKGMYESQNVLNIIPPTIRGFRPNGAPPKVVEAIAGIFTEVGALTQNQLLDVKYYLYPRSNGRTQSQSSQPIPEVRSYPDRTRQQPRNPYNNSPIKLTPASSPSTNVPQLKQVTHPSGTGYEPVRLPAWMKWIGSGLAIGILGVGGHAILDHYLNDTGETKPTPTLTINQDTGYADGSLNAGGASNASNNRPEATPTNPGGNPDGSDPNAGGGILQEGSTVIISVGGVNTEENPNNGTTIYQDIHSTVRQPQNTQRFDDVVATATTAAILEHMPPTKTPAPIPTFPPTILTPNPQIVSAYEQCLQHNDAQTCQKLVNPRP